MTNRLDTDLTRLELEKILSCLEFVTSSHAMFDDVIPDEFSRMAIRKAKLKIKRKLESDKRHGT